VGTIKRGDVGRTVDKDGGVKKKRGPKVRVGRTSDDGWGGGLGKKKERVGKKKTRTSDAPKVQNRITLPGEPNVFNMPTVVPFHWRGNLEKGKKSWGGRGFTQVGHRNKSKKRDQGKTHDEQQRQMGKKKRETSGGTGPEKHCKHGGQGWEPRASRFDARKGPDKR